MKKIISFALALVMTMSFTITVFAATLNEDNKTGSVIVKTSKLKDTDGDDVGDTTGENFVITIPADTTIPWLSAKAWDMGYTVTAQLETAHKISIAVAGSAESTLKTSDKAYSLPYSFTGTKSYTSEGPVVTAQKVDLSLKVTNWAGVPVDEYSDTLTYTASIA